MQERGDILEDWQLGCDHLMFHGKLKLSVPQTIPLLFVGLANWDESLARRCANRAVAICNGTRGRVHHQLSLEYMDEEGEIWKELVAFAGGRRRDQCPSLCREMQWLQLVRCNEVSAERLHKIGTVEARHAPCHSATVLSYGLRAPEIARHGWGPETFQSWAQKCEQVRSIEGIVKAFKLETHPALQADRDKMLLSGRKFKPLMVRHKTVKEVFYIGDMATQFNKMKGLVEAIKKAASQLSKDRQSNITDPFSAAKAPNADESVARHGFSVKHAIGHFQEISDEAKIYTLPAGFMTETLG